MAASASVEKWTKTGSFRRGDIAALRQSFSQSLEVSTERGKGNVCGGEMGRISVVVSQAITWVFSLTSYISNTLTH